MGNAAQWERRIIGQRTRDALAVKRAQGVKLGRPATLPEAVAERIVAARTAGESLSAIARALNDEGCPHSARRGEVVPVYGPIRGACSGCLGATPEREFPCQGTSGPGVTR
jgi:hypothetical protein